MWPFSKKQETKEIVNPFIEEFPIGERFKYLGATMIATSHWDHFAAVMSGAMVPKLTADYFDGNGVLRQASFCVAELPGLKSENERGSDL